MEVLTALTIAAIIISAITGFLLSNVKSYEVTQDTVDMQYQAQIALNIMAEIAMQSNGVELIYNGSSGNYMNVAAEVRPHAVVFKANNYYHVFTQDMSVDKDYILNYVKLDENAYKVFPANPPSSDTVEDLLMGDVLDYSPVGCEPIAKNVIFYCTPGKDNYDSTSPGVMDINNTEDFEESKSIELKIVIAKDKPTITAIDGGSTDERFEFKTLVKYRNK